MVHIRSVAVITLSFYILAGQDCSANTTPPTTTSSNPDDGINGSGDDATHSEGSPSMFDSSVQADPASSTETKPHLLYSGNSGGTSTTSLGEGTAVDGTVTESTTTDGSTAAAAATITTPATQSATAMTPSSPSTSKTHLTTAEDVKKAETSSKTLTREVTTQTSDVTETTTKSGIPTTSEASAKSKAPTKESTKISDAPATTLAPTKKTPSTSDQKTTTVAPTKSTTTLKSSSTTHQGTSTTTSYATQKADDVTTGQGQTNTRLTESMTMSTVDKGRSTAIPNPGSQSNRESTFGKSGVLVIVILSIVCLILLMIIIVLCCRRKKMQHDLTKADEEKNGAQRLKLLEVRKSSAGAKILNASKPQPAIGSDELQTFSLDYEKHVQEKIEEHKRKAKPPSQPSSPTSQVSTFMLGKKSSVKYTPSNASSGPRSPLNQNEDAALLGDNEQPVVFNFTKKPGESLMARRESKQDSKGANPRKSSKGQAGELLSSDI